MLRLLKSSFWSFISILVRAVSNIAINKLFAIFYGPNGITLYAHFQNLVSIVTTVPDGGVNIGLVKFLAPEKPLSKLYQQYFWAGMLLNLVCVLAALGLIFGFPGYYLEPFLGDLALGSAWQWGLLFGSGAVLLSLNLGFMAVVLSRQALMWHVFGNVIMSVGGVLVVYFSNGNVLLSELLLWVLLAQASSFFLMLAVLYFKRLLPSLGSIHIPKSIYKDLWKYILMALSAVVCLKLTNFYVRDFVIERFNLYQTGLWQAVVKVSENYSNVYTSVIGMLVYPRVAAMVNDYEALRKFVRNTFYMILPGLAAALLLVYFLRGWVLLLLFNKDFIKAEYLFDYQLLGDFFKMGSIILTNLIVVRAQVKLYIGWQIASALLYITLVTILLKPFGLEGITIAHALRYAVTLGFAMLYYNKYIRI